MSPGDPRHGTTNGYNNLGCRCDRCREAWKLYWRARPSRTGMSRAEWAASRVSHGWSRYKKGCRCAVCREASARNRRKVRRKQGMRSVPALQKYPEAM